MFKNSQAFSSFSVPDLNKAKDFYSGVLDLDVQETLEGLELRFANGASVFVYQSDRNKPADFTVLNFPVENVEKAVDELAKKGVRMEQYDMPGIKTDEKGIARSEEMGPRAIAWFKDPAGNILSVMQEK